jgi:hypothetical protein
MLTLAIEFVLRDDGTEELYSNVLFRVSRWRPGTILPRPYTRCEVYDRSTCMLYDRKLVA